MRYSAEDALREGFAPAVIEDACRGIDIGGADLGGSVAGTRDMLAKLGIACIDSEELG